MKFKRIIRFYYSADSLNGAIDGLIKRIAFSAEEGFCLSAAERICDLIGVKRELCGLWDWLDKVFASLTAEDRKALKRYGALRGGVSALPQNERREIHRASVKFARRTAKLPPRLYGALGAVDYYYALLRSTRE